jgi:hypothetical protein
MQINSDQPFDGYKGQKQQSETKVVRYVLKNVKKYQS